MQRLLLRWKQILCAFSLAIMIAPSLLVTAQTGPTRYDPSVCKNDITGKPLSAACQAMIAAFPAPTYLQVEMDGVTLSNYSFWKVGPNPTPKFDQPNGNIVAEIPAGFNYVRVLNQSNDGWLQIEGGQWIRQTDAQVASASAFRGRLIDDGLIHPIAWVLDLSTIYTSEFPGGPASKNTNRYLKRYELVFIYAQAKDTDGWIWYMIGPNQWVKQTFVAHPVPVKRPKGVSGHWVSVDLYEQVLIAYEDDIPVFATLISSGLPEFSTNEGLFKVWAKVERDGMSGATGAPGAYALQSVPWVMYFDDGISLHGTYWHDLFGYRHSHGCVNLTISDAKWIYRWFENAKPDKDGNIVNHVYVWSSGTYGSGVIRDK